MRDDPDTHAMNLPVSWQCPVCAARFRGSRFCSRCGADLTPLMKLAHAAWQARQAARAALAAGDGARALALADRAQRLHATAAGGRVRLLAAWLAARGAET